MMNLVRSNLRPAALSLLSSIALGAGCASIIDFDGPFASTTSGSGGSGGSGGGSTTSSTSTGCTPTTSCKDEGAVCGTVFDGCITHDCGSCAAPLMCSDARTCECPNKVTSAATLVADTFISPNASWVCGSLTSGTWTCLNLTVEPQMRGLLKFSLDGAVAAAIAKPGSLLSAKLTIQPADVCQSTNFTPMGKLDAWVMRTDWDESDARWCHRSGAQGDTTTAPWGAQGANDAMNDFGPFAGSVDLPKTNTPFTIDLDPKAIEASSGFVVGNKIAFRLVGEPGSTLVIKAKEWGAGAGATLVVEYCP